MTWRRLRVFVDRFPVESATVTGVRDALTPAQRAELSDRERSGHGPWSLTDQLLALVADRIAQQTWVLGEWKKRPPAPTPIRRPGVDDTPTHRGPATSVAELKSRVTARTWAVAEALRHGLPLPPDE